MKELLTFFTLLFTLSLSAQTEISGIVIEKGTQAPLEFAEVILVTESPSNMIGEITDIEGRFKLSAKSGAYTLKVVYIGQILYTKELVLEDKAIDLGTIEIESSVQLDELVVVENRKLIQRKIDRLVFDVENSSKASEGDALEVLRVTPGVQVQNDQITMIGKSNLQVMINDKIVQLSQDELVNFLRSISSEDIKNVEVITTPPAKYEASGNSGLINITLKEAKKDSWNAQLRSRFIQRRYSATSFGGSFNFNKSKFSLATSANYGIGDYYQEQDDYAYFPDGLWYTSSPFRAAIDRVNARMDVNYQVTPKWSMGGQYLYSNVKFAVTDAPYTPVYDYETNEIIRSLQSEGTIDLDPKLHSINYNNEIAIDTLGRKITLNLDYFNYSNPDTKKYEGVSSIEKPFSEQFYRGINTNKQGVTNVSAKLDIEYPLNWMNLDFGGKISKSDSQNDILFFNSGFVNNPVQELPLSENDFEYKEDIQALYISVNKEFSDKWSAQVGLRMEATQANSKSNNLDLATKNNYTKFFPTFYCSYNASDNSNFSFNYSKRIQRPNFFELNPNIYFINPFQTIEGNAFLQPAFIDNLELTNTYKNFTSKIYYSYEDNLFSQVPLPNPNTNIIRFANENFINRSRIGFSENYTFDKILWWTSDNSFDINYSKSEFSLEEPQEAQKGINASISTYNDFNLNSDKTLILGVNYWYNFPGINGIFETKAASSLSFSLKSLLLDKNLSISLRASDVFKSSAERTTATVNGVYQTARYYFDSRMFQIAVSYKFGNKDIKAKRHQTGNADEKGRTGN